MRRTVRLRLTLLYGGLFLISGAALLGMTYGLVVRNTDGFVFNTNDGRTSVVSTPDDKPKRPPSTRVSGERSDGGGADPARAAAEIRRVEAQARDQHDSVLRELLVQSGVALAAMAVVSIGLGWIVAGRVLRPLRTITATARDISATNLNKRLALAGPNDELKELGDTFDELLGRLEASFRSQRQFVANASHELRTPLACQRTVAQVALADPDASAATLRGAHERVLAAGAQQERLIEALLMLSRGQARLEKRAPFDLATIAEQVMLARRAEADRAGITITSALDPAPTEGSPQLAERLVANLVGNALRYNVPDGVVELTTTSADGHAALTVANSGAAIPAAAVDKLFEPFQRLDNPRRAPRWPRTGPLDRARDRRRPRGHGHRHAPPGRWPARRGAAAQPTGVARLAS